MLQRALKLKEDKARGIQFADVDESLDLAGAIGGGVNAGLMRGDAAGTFRPDESVTRQELALILQRVLQRHQPEAAPNEGHVGKFAELLDREAIAPWAEEGVRFVIERGLMAGRPGPRFAPAEQTTRAEAAAVIKRLLPGDGDL